MTDKSMIDDADFGRLVDLREYRNNLIYALNNVGSGRDNIELRFSGREGFRGIKIDKRFDIEIDALRGFLEDQISLAGAEMKKMGVQPSPIPEQEGEG